MKPIEFRQMSVEERAQQIQRLQTLVDSLPGDPIDPGIIDTIAKAVTGLLVGWTVDDVMALSQEEVEELFAHIRTLGIQFPPASSA
jgi:hypothetical protein